MTNNSKKQNDERIEAIFEAVLRAAAKEAMYEEIKAMTSNEQLDCIDIPDSLNARIYSIIAKESAALKRRRVVMSMGRCAASIALVLIIGSASVFVSLKPVQAAAAPGMVDVVDFDYTQDMADMDMDVPPADDEHKDKETKLKKLIFKYRSSKLQG